MGDNTEGWDYIAIETYPRREQFYKRLLDKDYRKGFTLK